MRDALGRVVLGGYPVGVYRDSVATLSASLPSPDKCGLLVFHRQEGVIVIWDEGGVEHFDAEWVKTHVVVDR